MATQADIDRNNAEYANAQNAANYHLSQGNTQAAHEAHKVMQRYAEENQRIAAAVAKANDDFHKANKTGPYAVSVSSSSTSVSQSATTVSAKPESSWVRTFSYAEPVGVKQADPDIVIFDTETISPELLIQLEYEDISGTELINISRSDIIDGQQVVYSPIKNLSSLRRKYNPNNIISLTSTTESIFSKYLIDLVGRGPGEPYFDDNGDLVIEIESVFDDEDIETEIDVNGTINTVEFL